MALKQPTKAQLAAVERIKTDPIIQEAILTIPGVYEVLEDVRISGRARGSRYRQAGTEFYYRAKARLRSLCGRDYGHPFDDLLDVAADLMAGR